jgi:adenylate cyclase
MKRILAALGLTAAAALLAGGLGLIPLLQTLELKTYDLRTRWVVGNHAGRDDIVAVDIDEESLRRFEPLVGRWPWPRLVHAQLVDFLARGPARAILYDILFTERDRRTFMVGSEAWTGEESDRTLAASVAKAGTVVLMADAVPEPVEGAPPAPPLPDLPALQKYRLDVQPEPRPIVVLPFDDLARSARAIGHSFVVLDADGPLRRVVPFVQAGSVPIASGPLATAMVATQTGADGIGMDREFLTVAGRRVPLIETAIPTFSDTHPTGYRTMLRYTGTYRHFSAYDLFYSEQQLIAGVQPDLDPLTFRDKIVIVGTTAAGLGDVFTIPLAGKMPGSEIHANFIESLLSGRFMARARASLSIPVLLSCALVVSCASVWLGPWWAIGIGIGSAGALWWGSLALFRAGIWLPLIPSAMAIALAEFGGTAYHYVVEGREKRVVKQLFSRFVSHDIYERLLADPSRAALGGERREMTVLFSDIRGFTTLSEASTPEEIVSTLNDYFTHMVGVILANGGTIDKFVGDMVMALFGAPLDDPKHAEHAVQTALAMAAELDSINASRVAEGKPPLNTGIGINTGPMVAGMIGSARILSYTVIGDAVNLGSRLESLNKQYGTRIIISDTTRQQLERGYDMRPLGEVTVKGRSQPVSIFEVKGMT